ncbi:MAG: MBL fold metallo-hydrolase [Acidihalobacter sp.]
MAVELYKDAHHSCLAFGNLVTGSAVQANQFMIIDHDEVALLDPGGDLTFTALSNEVTRHVRLENLKYLLASHQDPDIITSMQSWLTRTNASIVCSELWARFIPHLLPMYMGDKVAQRCVAVPDKGMDIPLGATLVKAVPAHFLHSVGNFQFYDPISRILFSGDMGASVGSGDVSTPVTDFDAHIPRMLGFHRRYMCSNRVCRLWANMVRSMDVSMIVPQHGQPFKGPEMIGRFLDWISELKCGVDLLTQQDYTAP